MPLNRGTLPALGRLPAPDARDQKFLLPNLRAEAAPVNYRYWDCYGVLDQKDTPQCVGYAVWNWLASGPVKNVPKFTPEWLYHQAQHNDEWPGEDYDGTSGRGAFKVLKSLGYVSSYSWATAAEPVINWLLTKGPVCVGTNWYRDMFTPDRKGFLEPAGPIEGGHEWLLIGANRATRCTGQSEAEPRHLRSRDGR